MITKEINGKIYSMDESEFIKYAYVSRNTVYNITVVSVELNSSVNQLFNFEYEADKPTYNEINSYIISLGIKTREKGKIIFIINHDYETEFLFPDWMTGKEQFLTYRYLRSKGY